MDIRLPNLSEGVSAGTVVAVLVSVGDILSKEQAIVELETEKAVAQIPSPAAGKVERIHVKEGDKLSVGQVILTVAGQSCAASPAPETPKTSSQPASSQETPPSSHRPSSGNTQDYHYQSPSGFPPPASPSLRKMASQLGIDLTRIRGSADGGRITIEDVRGFLQGLQTPPGSHPGAPLTRAVPVDFAKWGPVERKPVTSLRNKISEQMVRSWTTIPHVTQFDEMDVTDLMALRKKYAQSFEKQGARLTPTSFILKALAEVLTQHPLFNASLDESSGEVVFKRYIHIGIAVDTEQGLIVPVLRDVDKKSLFDLSVELHSLAERTRQRKVALEEMKGSSFTLSNQGGIGSGPFTPIINKPDSAILGIGRGGDKPVAAKGKIVIRHLLPVTLSYDHRLIDGGSAARFMVSLAKALTAFKDTDLESVAKKSDPQKTQKKSARKKR